MCTHAEYDLSTAATRRHWNYVVPRVSFTIKENECVCCGGVLDCTAIGVMHFPMWLVRVKQNWKMETSPNLPVRLVWSGLIFISFPERLFSLHDWIGNHHSLLTICTNPVLSGENLRKLECHYGGPLLFFYKYRGHCSS